MEIVLLYKFYIFSFLNLKRGERKRRREGRREGGKQCSEPELQSTAASREMACTSIKMERKMQLGHLKVTGLGFSIPVGQRPLFHNKIYKVQTFYNISTLTPEGSNENCLLASLK